MRRTRLIQSIVLHVAITAFALLFLLPIFWMILSATKANHVILAVPPSFAFGDHLGANWAELTRDLPFLRNVVNSIGISVIYTIVATLVCAMGGYALAKFEFWGRAAVFTLILVALTIPFEVRIIPQYILIARDLGLTNTWWAIILPGLANALGMFFMRQNMLSVPSELLEAARIDGASEARIFVQVVLPIMQPALAAVGILLLLFQWNDFLWPLLVLTARDAYTIPVALGTLVGLTRVSWGGIMVGTAIATVPFLIMFLFLQRYFVAGITAGAVKD
ncbi:MAG: carbohydrate ABC transporter permease [Trueperaceae bacterium]|nr:carbohydrate ABC transporter permease [Trueperaceae bacterium]